MKKIRNREKRSDFHEYIYMDNYLIVELNDLINNNNMSRYNISLKELNDEPIILRDLFEKLQLIPKAFPELSHITFNYSECVEDDYMDDDDDDLYYEEDEKITVFNNDVLLFKITHYDLSLNRLCTNIPNRELKFPYPIPKGKMNNKINEICTHVVLILKKLL